MFSELDNDIEDGHVPQCYLTPITSARTSIMTCKGITLLVCIVIKVRVHNVRHIACIG